jgi:8-oxo-dGTP diphosphatase
VSGAAEPMADAPRGKRPIDGPTPAESPPVVVVAAAIVLDGRRTLLVRKHGTTAFMNPGGKIEPGESPAGALCRELAEELDMSVAPSELSYLGRFSADAANEPGYRVQAEAFLLRVDGRTVRPRREIAEAVWVDPARPSGRHIAPLATGHLLPLAVRYLASAAGPGSAE